MNTDKKVTYRPEAIALASGLVSQGKGDITTTRAIVAESLAWLQSIDPSYRRESLSDQEVERIGEIQGELDEERRTRATFEVQVKELRSRVESSAAGHSVALGQIDMLTRDNLELRNRLSAATAAVKPAVVAPVIPPPPIKPVAVAPVVKVAPVAQAGSVDPFGHLPAHMQAWARAKSAATFAPSAPGIEID